MEVNGQLHTPNALSPGNDPPVHMRYDTGGRGPRTFLDAVEKRKNLLLLLGLESLDCPARGLFLHELS
jgi:hypothetical protein